MKITDPAKKPRIQVVDALCCLAICAIIIPHNIEHFNFFLFPEPASPLIGTLDDFVLGVFSVFSITLAITTLQLSQSRWWLKEPSLRAVGMVVVQRNMDRSRKKEVTI